MSPKDLDAENDNAERGGGTTRFWNSTQSSSTTLEDTTMTLADAMKNNSAFTRTTCTATKFDLLAELRGLLALAFPSVALQFNMYVVYPLAASTVGHLLETQELAGFSLGCLVGNLTCLSITVGVLTAADTLMPRAYGAGRYAEVGRLAVRAMAVGTAALAVPMIPLCAVLEPVMVFLGQDPVPARLAAEWIRIYLLGVPATLLLRTLQRFLVAQSLPWPPVYATTVPALAIFPIMVPVFVAHMGFLGSAAAIAIAQWLMVLFLLAYLRMRPVYKVETWPGLSWALIRESIMRLDRMKEFSSLSLGGVLGLSEWWFCEVMCVIAGCFGTVAFVAHSIAYSMWILAFMIPLGFSIGTVVRIGQELPTNPRRAHLIADWSLTLTIVIGCFVGTIMYLNQDFVVGMFTTDPAVFDACRQIWHLVCIHLIIDYILGVQGAIMRALAMQWRMAVCITSCLWGLSFPMVLCLAVRNGGGLKTMWILLPLTYTITNTAMRLSYAYVDWNAKSKEAQRKLQHSSTELGTQGPMEETSLLPQQNDSVVSP